MKKSVCAHCGTSIPRGRVTCGAAACVKAQNRLTNARNHKERWDARLAAGLCGRCGARARTAGCSSCATCRGIERARRAERIAKAAAEAEHLERLLAKAARKARTADAAAKRREAGLPLARSNNQRIAKGAMPPQEV